MTERKAKRVYSRSGLYQARRALMQFGNRAIDGRTSVGKALTQWRAELVNDLGGDHAVSKQQSVVVDLAARTHLLLQSVDHWLLQQRSLINLRKRALLPVVIQRQQLADSLARYMAQLGLERRARPVKTLAAHVAENYGTGLPEDGGSLSSGDVPQQATEEAGEGSPSPCPPSAAPFGENGGNGGEHGDSGLAKRSGSVPV